MRGDVDVRSLEAAEDEGGQFVVPGEAIDAGPVRGVLDGHQFNGRLGELRRRGVGPINIPLEKAGDRQGGGLCARPGEVGDGSREAGRSLSESRVRAGRSRNAVEHARGITPSGGGECGKEGGTVPGPVEGVVPLFDEEGEVAWVALGGA